MATSTPSQLTRALRRGSVPTRTVPQNGHVMGPPAGAVPEDDPMAELAATLGPAGNTTTAPGGAAPVAAAPGPEAPAQHLAPLAATRSDPPAVPPAGGAAKPTAPLRMSSRSVRYAVPASDPLSTAPPSAAPAASPAPGSGRPWAQFVDQDRTPEAVDARKAMSAAKVVAPLVAAVSFHPGSSATPKDMSQSLAAMMVAVHKTSTQIAERFSQQYGQDVPRWCVSQLMQTLAEVVARRWERSGTADVGQLGDLVSELLTNQDGEVTRMLLEAAEQAYVEATSADVAANRVAVSTAGAAWTLYDWVTHDKLALSGEVPSRFYSYDLEPAEVVTRMLKLCVSFCRAIPLNVDSADLRVAHLQASVRRMAALMGAEYVAQTRVVMDWIGDPAISDAEFAARKAAAAEQFETRIVPHVFEWARRNFLRVEQGAFQAIEDLNEKDNRDSGGGAAARPVQQ